MAAFTLEIPDSQRETVVTAICALHGWTPEIDNPAFNEREPEGPENPRRVPHPQTASEFAQSRVVAYLAECVQAHAARRARELAEAAEAPPLSITVSEG